ncbi:MAG: alpha-L-fucosidase, partial [Mycoplasmatales bacterium]
MQKWFDEKKLGIFIHYGIYSVKGVSESWSFYNGRISYKDYMDQLNGFTASKFDADKWAKLIKKSGAGYAVLTAKHHDGVALFDTKFSDLSIQNKTNVKVDIVGEFCKSLKKEDIKTGIYFSHIDWSDDRYPSIICEGSGKDDPILKNKFSTPSDLVEDYEKWQKFLDFNINQITELMTNYGTVDLLWFDGDWERSKQQWKMDNFIKTIRDINGDVIINSRVCDLGDYKTPEQILPVIVPNEKWEYCTTINDNWGYVHTDIDFKTPLQIIKTFCEVISMGGNMLLNIGPLEDGSIEEHEEHVLLELGDWIEDNSESIYKTIPGIGSSHFHGGSTLNAEKDTLYLFVYDYPKDNIFVKGICNDIKKISILHSGKELNHKKIGGASWFDIPGVLWIDIDAQDCHKYVTIVKIELDSKIKLYKGEGQP